MGRSSKISTSECQYFPTTSGIQVPFYFVILTHLRFPKLGVLLKGTVFMNTRLARWLSDKDPPANAGDTRGAGSVPG